jgi:hypothetical protein
MALIELTGDEVRMLHDLLTSELGDLQNEIAHTDDRGCRDGLRKLQGFVQSLIERLEAEHVG